MLHLHRLSHPTLVDAYIAELYRLMETCEHRRPDLRDRPLRALMLAAGGDIRPHPKCADARLVTSRRPASAIWCAWTWAPAPAPTSPTRSSTPALAGRAASIC